MPSPLSPTFEGYAAANRIRILRHAWQRMGERGAQYEDVRP
jgi:hypothetical protein